MNGQGGRLPKFLTFFSGFFCLTLFYFIRVCPCLSVAKNLRRSWEAEKGRSWEAEKKKKEKKELADEGTGLSPKSHP